MKCHVCHQEIVKNHITHRTYCFGDDFDYKIKFLAYNIPDVLNKDLFYQKYIVEKWSIPMICRMLNGLDIKNVCYILNYHGIKIRTVKETRHLNEYKERIESTNLTRFGAINPLCKGTDIFKKRNETVKHKYGVDNVFQCLENFNTEYNKRGSYSTVSSLNKKIAIFLTEENIEFQQEFPIRFMNSEGKMFTRYYDIKTKNLIIELNGKYYHADPRLFKETDIVRFPKSSFTAKELWLKDEFKKELAIKNGYEYLVIWETEIKKDFENVKTIIKNKIDKICAKENESLRLNS